MKSTLPSQIHLRFIAAACVAALLTALAAPARQALAAGALAELDESQLAATLQTLRMYEMLLSLSQTSSAPEIQRQNWAINALLGLAEQKANRQEAEDLIDQAIKKCDALAAATKDNRDFATQAQYFRALMQRVVAEGLVKTEPYAQRMLYLLDNPADRQKVAALSESALKYANELQRLLSDAQREWAGSDDAKICGAYFEVEAMLPAIRYRLAWLHFYLAMSTPPEGASGEKRKDMLQQVLTNLSEFSAAQDVSPDIRAWANLLTGMGWRELGKYDEAAKVLQPLTEEGQPSEIRLKALFEMTRGAIERGRSDAEQAAIEKFRAEAAKLPGLAPIASEMQATLLQNHLYALQAKTVEAQQPQKANEYQQKSGLVMLNFLKDHPDYTEAFTQAVGSRYEGQDPEKLPVELAVLLGTAKSFDPDPQSQALAEKAFLAVLKDKDSIAKNPTPSIMAMGSLGAMYEKQNKNLLAAARFCELAETFPQNSQAQRAAWRAVLDAEKVVQEPNAAEAEHKEYTRALTVLTKHWAADPEVRPYFYPLGLEMERVSQTKEAIQAFSAIQRGDESYVPARMHVLNLQGQELVAAPKGDLVTAQRFIGEIREFHRQVLEFKAPTPDRQAMARQMGAQMDLLAAQVQLDVLTNPKDARGTAEQARQDWADVPEVGDHCLRLAIQAYLAEENLDKAIELFDQIKKGAEEVVAEVVLQVRQRLETLDPRRDAKDFDKYLKNYLRFAEKLHETAETRFKDKSAGQPRGWFEQQMYTYDQILAGAYEYTTDKQLLSKALLIYQALAKQNRTDAINIRGQARCNRKLGAYIEAMKLYDKLVAGLPDRSPGWWKAQLERAQFAEEVTTGKERAKILLQLKLLQDRDPNMGGLAPQFAEVRAKVESTTSKESK